MDLEADVIIFGLLGLLASGVGWFMVMVFGALVRLRDRVSAIESRLSVLEASRERGDSHSEHR